MEWVETTGKTIEEARDAALDQLGVDETDAEFVTVTEPKAGLFGRMRGEARVRARVRPTSPRPKRTRTRRTGEQRDSGARRSGGSGRTGDRSRSTATVADGADAEAGDGATGAPSTNGTGSSSNRRRRSRSRGGGAGRSGEQSVNGDRDGEPGEGAGTPPQSSTRRKGSRPSGSTKEEAVGETMTLEEQGESAREFIAGLIDELGLDADVSTRVVDEETAEVVVEGQELGVLVGPGGATLAALQELARTFVQKRTGGQSSRINVDVAGYRAKRTAALQRFATQVAEEVTGSGSDRALEPMSAADRKVVHDTINEIDGLSTRSEGEEPRRYVVISSNHPAADVAEGA
ncbi:MAG TPA: RNA-binding cell elongation regulator Jag/EloR [Acidimicrobiales bacterium]